LARGWQWGAYQEDHKGPKVERRRDLKAGCFIKAHLYQTGVKVDP